MTSRAHEVIRQISEAGYIADFASYNESSDGTTFLGTVKPEALSDFVLRLKVDPRFMNGIFYGLHRDVGPDLIDFRSIRGVLGKGSLQLVVSSNGTVYADIDGWNPYQDVVNTIGHIFVDMFRWGKGDRA